MVLSSALMIYTRSPEAGILRESSVAWANPAAVSSKNIYKVIFISLFFPVKIYNHGCEITAAANGLHP